MNIRAFYPIVLVFSLLTFDRFS